MKHKGIPHQTLDMQNRHTSEDVPIVGDSSNSEWDPKSDSTHQGAHNQAPTTEVNTVRKTKIYK